MKLARSLRNKSLIAYLVSDEKGHMAVLSGIDPRRVIDGVFRQAGQISFQPLPVFGCQDNAQRTRQRAFQPALPTGLLIMQIGPPAIHFA